MKYILVNSVATTSGQESDLFGSLGIDWKLLIIQSIAFLILLFILKRFVYPPLIAMLDARDNEASAARKAAQLAQEQAAASEARTTELLHQAKAEAAEIVTTAKDEAASIVHAAEDKASTRADSIVAAAKSEIETEVEAARKLLYNETINLVAQATEKVAGKAVSETIDTGLIEASLQEVSR